MPQISTLIDIYIDANIILILAFLVWVVTLHVLNRTHRARDFALQLQVTEGLMIAAVLSPVVAAVVLKLTQSYFPQVSINAADIAVAQFLDGRVKMEAAEFERLLSTRQDFVTQLAGLQTPLAKGLVVIFAVGFLLGVVRVIGSMLKLKRLLANSFIWRRFGKLDLLISDEITVPFSTRTLFRKKIVIPSDLLVKSKELRMVVAHELEHMRRKDIEWEFLLVLLQPLFFWNPAFVFWKRSLEQLRELRCDAALIERKRVSSRDYAHCLLDVCESGITGNRSILMLSPKVPFLKISQGMMAKRNCKILERRISEISSSPNGAKQRTMLLWSVLPIAALVVGIGASVIQKPGDWSHDRLMLSTIVNLERLESINSNLGMQGF